VPLDIVLKFEQGVLELIVQTMLLFLIQNPGPSLMVWGTSC
jgi:hypothetical protein